MSGPYSYQAIQGSSVLVDVYYRVCDAADNPIATCYLEENAKLVVRLMNAGAAAPDLLAACVECERLLLELGDPFSGDDQEAMQRVRAAIARATQEGE